MFIDPQKNGNAPWNDIEQFLTRSMAPLQIGANLIGACIVTSYFVFFGRVVSIGEVKSTFFVVGIMFIVLVVIASAFQNRWLRDMKRFVHLKKHDRTVDEELARTVQRKILNLPFFTSLCNLFNWFLAAVTMSLYGLLSPFEAQSSSEIFFQALQTFIGVIISGVVTSVIIFFSVEVYSRRISPLFFPDGGLVQTVGAFRLRLRVRMFVIFVLASILPLILMAVLSYNKATLMLVMDSEKVIQSLLYLTAFLLVVTLALAVILSRLFSKAIIGPVSKMEAAMLNVEKGDFTANVPVVSNDEMGVLAEHFNQMTEGLKERYRLRRSLDLAKEVQQNLLPIGNPVVDGLDIAGTSIYCDETGGDYFDFLGSDELGDNKFGVLVGDVSGHGIPSALLMATARAFLRQRCALPGSIAEIITDVNFQLARDVEETGSFMTLFFLLIDQHNQDLHWVRAGHDPALFYDPAARQFAELHGPGIALGVDATWQYVQQTQSELTTGQVILLGTDGIWEAQNSRGQLLGKELLFDTIRENSDASAQDILNAIIDETNRFREGQAPTDDVTLVIIKIT